MSGIAAYRELVQDVLGSGQPSAHEGFQDIADRYRPRPAEPDAATAHAAAEGYDDDMRPYDRGMDGAMLAEIGALRAAQTDGFSDSAQGVIVLDASGGYDPAHHAHELYHQALTAGVDDLRCREPAAVLAAAGAAPEDDYTIHTHEGVAEQLGVDPADTAVIALSPDDYETASEELLMNELPRLVEADGPRRGLSLEEADAEELVAFYLTPGIGLDPVQDRERFRYYSFSATDVARADDALKRIDAAYDYDPAALIDATVHVDTVDDLLRTAPAEEPYKESRLNGALLGDGLSSRALQRLSTALDAGTAEPQQFGITDGRRI